MVKEKTLEVVEKTPDVVVEETPEVEIAPDVVVVTPEVGKEAPELESDDEEEADKDCAPRRKRAT